MFSAVRKLVSLQTKVFICLIKTFFFISEANLIVLLK